MGRFLESVADTLPQRPTAIVLVSAHWLEPVFSVLIVGSGMSFHNMRGFGDPRFGPISDTFDRWLSATVEAEPAQRSQNLIDWAQAPAARLSHPPRAEEHLLPLMVAVGAADQDRGRCVFTDRVLETRLSAFRFG